MRKPEFALPSLSATVLAAPAPTDGISNFLDLAVSENAVYAVGAVAVSDTDTDLIVVAYGLDGVEQWTAVALSSPLVDAGVEIAWTGDRVVAVGHTAVAAGDEDAVIVEISSNGTVGVTDIYSGDAGGSERALAIATDETTDEYVVAGRATVDGEGFNAWMRSYSAGGAPQWTIAAAGGPAGDQALRGVALGGPTEAIACGHTTGSDGVPKPWLLAVERSSGEILRAYVDDDTALGDARAAHCVIDGDGAITAVGTTDTSGDTDALVLRYIE